MADAELESACILKARLIKSFFSVKTIPFSPQRDLRMRFDRRLQRCRQRAVLYSATTNCDGEDAYDGNAIRGGSMDHDSNQLRIGATHSGAVGRRRRNLHTPPILRMPKVVE
jgi:hypothetical protein